MAGARFRLLSKNRLLTIKEFVLFSTFRKIAFAEGISFLVLLLIAMPLKYWANYPMAVKVVGYLHGALFVAFVVAALLVKDKYNRNFGWLVKAGLASVIPFGTLYMEKFWKAEETILDSKF